MTYNGTIYRPPVEADTLLLPVTEGCSHNACRFCSMYKGVRFRMLSLQEIEEYLKEAKFYFRHTGWPTKRVYLVGADPFALSYGWLKPVIELIKRNLPECETITMYAAVRNIMRKSDDDLRNLRELGVDDLYVGIESGLEDVLDNLNKGNTVEQAREQCLRLNACGINHRDMLMLGAGGKGRGRESALAAAKLLNETKPNMILINSMSIFPDTALYADVKSGKFTPAGEKEMLEEEYLFIKNLELPDTYFWAVHSLDAVRFQGYLKDDKPQMLQLLDHAIKTIDEEKFAMEFQREHRHI